MSAATASAATITNILSRDAAFSGSTFAGEALEEMVTHTGADFVSSAIVGRSGMPAFCAVRSAVGVGFSPKSPPFLFPKEPRPHRAR